jgi:hypothetical protein
MTIGPSHQPPGVQPAEKDITVACPRHPSATVHRVNRSGSRWKCARGHLFDPTKTKNTRPNEARTDGSRD